MGLVRIAVWQRPVTSADWQRQGCINSCLVSTLTEWNPYLRFIFRVPTDLESELVWNIYRHSVRGNLKSRKSTWWSTRLKILTRKSRTPWTQRDKALTQWKCLLTCHTFGNNVWSNIQVFEFRVTLVLGHDKCILFHKIFFLTFFCLTVLEFLLNFLNETEGGVQVCWWCWQLTGFLYICATVRSVDEERQLHILKSFNFIRTESLANTIKICSVLTTAT